MTAVTAASSGTCPSGPKSVDDEPAAPPEHRPDAAERDLAHRVEHDVVDVAGPDEVLGGVVDHFVGTQGAHDLDVGGVAYGGDLGAEVLGELDPGSADRAGRAVDQDALAPAQGGPAQAGPGQHHAVAHGGRLVERQGRGLAGQRRALAHAHQLGVGAEAVGVDPEDGVAHGELGDRRAGGLDHARQLGAEHRPLRPDEPAHEPDHERLALAEAGVGPVDRGGMHSDQHLVVGRHRVRHLYDPENFGWAIALVPGCSHANLPPRRSGHLALDRSPPDEAPLQPRRIELWRRTLRVAPR